MWESLCLSHFAGAGVSGRTRGKLNIRTKSSLGETRPCETVDGAVINLQLGLTDKTPRAFFYTLVRFFLLAHIIETGSFCNQSTNILFYNSLAV